MSHEKTLNAFVSLLSMEKGFTPASSHSFSNLDRPAAVKSANSSWPLNVFLKSFSFGGNVQLFLPSLSVISPGDELKQHGDDLKYLTNNIIRTLTPTRGAATAKNVPLGYTNAQMLHNFSRRLVFSSGDKNASSESTCWKDILTTPDVLNENLVSSIRYIIDSRLKYYIATLVRKQLMSKKSISKPAAALLALQVNSKVPTELDDQNLILPFVDIWESPDNPDNNIAQQQVSNNHLGDTSQSSSLPTVKRKHGEMETEVEEERLANDNDFPFDMNERMRRFSSRITSCSMSFEEPKDGAPTSTTPFTSSSIPNSTLVCLPISMVAKATLDISIKHALTVNVAVETTGTIEGKFRGDLLEEIEILLDTKALFDSITKQVKLSIKNAIAMLLTTASKGSKPTSSSFHHSAKETSAEIWNHNKGLHDEKTKRNMSLQLNSRIANIKPSTFNQHKRASASIFQHPPFHPSFDHTQRSSMNNAAIYFGNSPNLNHEFVNLQQMNGHVPNSFLIDQVRNSRSYGHSYFPGHMNGYVLQPNGPVLQKPYHHAGFNATPFTDERRNNNSYNIDYNSLNVPYSFNGDPRSSASTMYHPNMANKPIRIEPMYSVQNASEFSASTGLYRHRAQSEMMTIPMTEKVKHMSSMYAAGPSNFEFAARTDAGGAYMRPNPSDIDAGNFVRPEPVMRRSRRMGSSSIPADIAHRMQMEAFHDEASMKNNPINLSNMNHRDQTTSRRNSETTILEPVMRLSSRMGSSSIPADIAHRMRMEAFHELTSMTNNPINSSNMNHREKTASRRNSGTMIPTISHAEIGRWMEKEEQSRRQQYPNTTHITDSDVPRSSEYGDKLNHQRGTIETKPLIIASGETDPYIGSQEQQKSQNGKPITKDSGSLPRRRSSFPIESVLAAVNLARISEQDEECGGGASEPSTPSDIRRRRSSTAAYAAIVRFLEEEEKSKGGDSEISIDTVAEFSRLIEFEEILRRSSAPAMLSAAETVRRWEIDNGLDRRESEISAHAAAEAARFLASPGRRRGSHIKPYNEYQT